MHLICINMQKICRKYAENMQKICRKYAEYMQNICRIYAPDMHLICKYMQKKYAEICSKYAEICIGAYFAYFAYICTTHFADGNLSSGSVMPTVVVAARA